jgi:hypothetical protein
MEKAGFIPKIRPMLPWQPSAWTARRQLNLYGEFAADVLDGREADSQRLNHAQARAMRRLFLQ